MQSCRMRTVRFGSHCKQNDWQTGVKTLPCPKLRLRAVIILLIPIMIYSSDPWDTFRGTNWGTINNVIRNILSKSVRLKSKQDLIVSHISWIGLKLGAKLIGSIEFFCQKCFHWIRWIQWQKYLSLKPATTCVRDQDATLNSLNSMKFLLHLGKPLTEFFSIPPMDHPYYSLTPIAEWFFYIPSEEWYEKGDRLGIKILWIQWILQDIL